MPATVLDGMAKDGADFAGALFVAPAIKRDCRAATIVNGRTVHHRPDKEGRLPQLARVALLVRDYDEAIAFFVGTLGFRLLEDTPLTPTKRWVVVAPDGDGDAALLLARAVGPEQLAAVGHQGGGRVFLFLHTDDFARDYTTWQARGVRFVEAPRDEVYGTVAVFEDLYGNRWDLIEPRPQK